jgi:hypothetical protein
MSYIPLPDYVPSEAEERSVPSILPVYTPIPAPPTQPEFSFLRNLGWDPLSRLIWQLIIELSIIGLFICSVANLPSGNTSIGVWALLAISLISSCLIGSAKLVGIYDTVFGRYPKRLFVVEGCNYICRFCLMAYPLVFYLTSSS